MANHKANAGDPDRPRGGAAQSLFLAYSACAMPGSIAWLRWGEKPGRTLPGASSSTVKVPVQQRNRG